MTERHYVALYAEGDAPEVWSAARLRYLTGADVVSVESGSGNLCDLAYDAFQEARTGQASSGQAGRGRDYGGLRVPQNGFLVPRAIVHHIAFTAGQTVAQALYLSGRFVVPALCSGMGRCGHCRVRFINLPEGQNGSLGGSDVPVTPADEDFFPPEFLALGWRLGCRHLARSGQLLLLPESTQRLAWGGEGLEKEVAAEFPCEWIAIDVGTTSIHWRAYGYASEGDGTARAAVGKVAGVAESMIEPGTEVGAQVEAQSETGAETAGTVGIAGLGVGNHILTKEGYQHKEGSQAEMFVSQRTELPEGPCGRKAVCLDGGVFPNPQMGAGSEVVSRVQMALSEQGREKLYSLSRRMLLTILRRVGGTKAVFLAANPAMAGITLGHDIASLAHAPYALPDKGGDWVNIEGLPPIWVAPHMAPFVGGDVSAGYAYLLTQHAEYPFLLADMGTNGEFVLALSPTRAFVASVALGPALEGVNLTYGSEAKAGVIVDFSSSPLGLEPVYAVPERQAALTTGEMVTGIDGADCERVADHKNIENALGGTGQRHTSTQRDGRSAWSGGFSEGVAESTPENSSKSSLANTFEDAANAMACARSYDIPGGISGGMPGDIFATIPGNIRGNIRGTTAGNMSGHISGHILGNLPENMEQESARMSGTAYIALLSQLIDGRALSRQGHFIEGGGLFANFLRRMANQGGLVPPGGMRQIARSGRAGSGQADVGHANPENIIPVQKNRQARHTSPETGHVERGIPVPTTGDIIAKRPQPAGEAPAGQVFEAPTLAREAASNQALTGGLPKRCLAEPYFPLPCGMFLFASDVEEILKVKAAFSLGLSRLLAHAGIAFHELRHVYLSGALGKHVDAKALENLGFFPPGAQERIVAIGNSALAGAICLGQNAALRQKIVEWSSLVTPVNLADDRIFQNQFPEHMQFSYLAGES